MNQDLTAIRNLLKLAGYEASAIKHVACRDGSCSFFHVKTPVSELLPVLREKGRNFRCTNAKDLSASYGANILGNYRDKVSPVVMTDTSTARLGTSFNVYL